MRYYFAPMEGITSHLYRAAHRRYFPGVDKYFLPFLSPGQHGVFGRKELQDLMPEHNEGIPAVPQLLTRRAEDFTWAAKALGRMGYREVNLNLGCPSGTVAAKGKGAGFLAFPEELDHFLEEIFSAAEVSVSVKTRLGVADPEEFSRLLEIYNKYPIAELTVHTRVREDFYKRPARPDCFTAILRESRAPLCYNGDLITGGDLTACAQRFPALEAVMAGRGLVANPALVTRAKGGPAADKETLRAFLEEIYGGYCAAFGSKRNAMMRMKELWFYLIALFADGAGYGKKLRKTTDPREFQALTDGIFRDLTLLPEAVAEWRS